MSALDDYLEAREGSLYAVTALTITTKADAAIAELQAALKELDAQWNAVVDKLAELSNPEPIHKEFVFACPACGNEGTVSIDVLPRGSDE